MLNKADSSLSVSYLSTKQLNAGNNHTLWSLIQGRVPGLMIAEQRGDNIPFAPNQLFSTSSPFGVQLRGMTTYRSQQQPLLVVDGIPLTDWELVDPWDIAQVTVLRDGAAAALYGGQAANGVILLETHQADSNSLSIQYNTFVAADQATRMIDLLDREQFLAASDRNEDWGGNTDWQQAITRTGISQAHQLALSGKLADISYRLSGSYRSQQRPLRESEWNRLNGRFQLSWKGLNERLSLQAWGAATRREERLGFLEAFNQAAFYSPAAPIRSNDSIANQFGGYFQRYIFNYQNPVAMIEQNDRRSSYQAQQLGGKIQLQLAEKLAWHTHIASMNNRTQDLQQLGAESFWLSGTLNPDTLEQEINNQRWMVESWLHGQKSWKKTQISASLGYSMQNQAYQHSLDSIDRSLALRGIFLRAEANFGTLASLGIHGRMDQSSIFSNENQARIYPAVFGKLSLGQLLKLPTHWTLRSSYSQVGNLLSDFYLQTPAFFFEENFQTFFERNDQLQQEVTSSLNVGTDINLFARKLRLSVDFFSRSSHQLMLLLDQAAPPNAYPLRMEGLGEFRTRGWEINAHLKLIQQIDQQFSIDINVYAFQSRYGAVAEPNERAEYNKFINMSPYFNVFPFPDEAEGDQVGGIWAPRYLGVSGGSAWNFDDLDNDGFISTADFIEAGNAFPDFSMGMGFQYRWKRWQISGLLRGRFGHQQVSPLYIGLFNGINTDNNRNQTVDVLASQQRWPDFVQYSSFFVENASFLQLNNLKVAYSISHNKPFIQLYFVTQNLFTLTSYRGIDPDVSMQSSGNILLPGYEHASAGYLPRSWVLGLSCKL